MRGESPSRLRALVATLAGAGFVLSAWAWLGVDGRLLALAFLTAAGVVELLPTRMRVGVEATLTSIVILTAVLVGGAPLAVCTSLGAVLVAAPRYPGRRVQKAAFNFGQLTVAAAAAGGAFALVGGTVGDPARPWNWAALFAAAGVFTFLNYGLIALAIHLSSGERVKSVLGSVFGSAIFLQVFYAALSILAAALLVEVGVTALLFLVIPALVARQGLLGFQEEAEAYDRLVSALMKAIEVKDGYTRGHAQRVSELCIEVGRDLGFSYEQLRAARYASMLHDVGKLNVPDAVLHKPGRLTREEFEEIHEHPMVGCELLAEIEFLRPALDGVRFHHERVDGGGYPYGVKGEDLPDVARIVTVCDAFDSMTSTRPYRTALTIETALAELWRCAGTQFDVRVVEVLQRVVERIDWRPTVEPYEPAHLERTIPEALA